MNSFALKNRAAFPFETIGVAIAFSPRQEAILWEARRLSEMLGARLVFIHVGAHDPEKEQMLNAMIANIGFDASKYKTVWEDGHPVDTILKVCKDNIVDLLIAGAVEKESIFRYYIGSVSREICRKAKCSVLMLTEPSAEGTRFKKMVVNGVEHPKTKHTLGAALYLAEKEKAEGITLVRELYLPALEMSTANSSAEPDKVKNEFLDDETERMNQLIDKFPDPSVPVEALTVAGKTGYAIANYARTASADLLVLNSPDHHLTIFDRLFTHDIEFILADLPCNLLLVHSRVESEVRKISY